MAPGFTDFAICNKLLIKLLIFATFAFLLLFLLDIYSDSFLILEVPGRKVVDEFLFRFDENILFTIEDDRENEFSIWWNGRCEYIFYLLHIYLFGIMHNKFLNFSIECYF